MRKEVTVFGFLAGALLFNWPFLSIFDQVLPAYIFLLWFGFIVFTMFAARNDGSGRRKDE